VLLGKGFTASDWELFQAELQVAFVRQRVAAVLQQWVAAAAVLQQVTVAPRAAVEQQAGTVVAVLQLDVVVAAAEQDVTVAVLQTVEVPLVLQAEVVLQTEVEHPALQTAVVLQIVAEVVLQTVAAVEAAALVQI